MKGHRQARPVVDDDDLIDDEHVDAMEVASTEDQPRKRQRISKACEMCRRKKIKCDGKSPICGPCAKFDTECVVLDRVRKVRTKPSKKDQHIRGLENRLERMERLLTLSGAMPHGEHSFHPGTMATDLASSNGDGEFREGRLASMATTSTVSDEDDISDDSNAFAPLPVSNIGQASSLSLFSREGIQWIREKTGSTSFESMITSLMERTRKLNAAYATSSTDFFVGHHRVPQALPQDAMSCKLLLGYFFSAINRILPIFDEAYFMQNVDRQYSNNPPKDVAWQVSLNIALAFAQRIKTETGSQQMQEAEETNGWAYAKNVFPMVAALTLGEPSLMAIQALLGIVVWLQCYPTPHASYFASGAALRLCHSLGLHRESSNASYNEPEREQRRRVFWVAYLLDKDLGSRSGRPPAQDDDFMDVQLPAETPTDGCGTVALPDGTLFNVFRGAVFVARILYRCTMSLYSAKASRQSYATILDTIGDLDARLEEWNSTVPQELKPEFGGIDALQTPDNLHVIHVRLVYYNVLTTIHRVAAHEHLTRRGLNQFASLHTDQPGSPRLSMSAAICANAARTSLPIVQCIPSQHYSFFGLIVYYPVSAFVSLFTKILQDPLDARSRADLNLMSTVVSFLEGMTKLQSSSADTIFWMHAVCSEFWRIAETFVEKSEQARSQGHAITSAGPIAPAWSFPEVPLSHPGDPQLAHSASVTQPAEINIADAFSQDGFGPQNLWQMPMTFEWDWAQGCGSGYDLAGIDQTSNHNVMMGEFGRPLDLGASLG